MQQPAQTQTQTQTSKETYTTPELQRFGDVGELTETNSPPPFSGNDGGSFPNNYAS